MTRTFTGWHMTVILVAFFGIVIGVNLIMALAAIGTFGGTVVDNSYVASQKYNAWLRSAARQDGLGWKAAMKLDGNRHLIVDVVRSAQPVPGLTAIATATHPLGRERPVELSFVRLAGGALRSTAPVPKGRWTVMLSARQGSDIARFRETVQ